jgi:tellurite methyltransferase
VPREDRDRWEARYRSGHGSISEPPSPFLVEHADLISGRVLDVAAGAGRHALFLARRRCIVEAIDISWTGLHLARAAAVAEGLCLLAVQADLENFPLPSDRYDAVINLRYLQRALLPQLQRAVKPGGLILVETFLIEQQTIGHPTHADFLLQRGELGAAFSQCDILLYEEGLFEAPQPAYLARLIARRPVPD